MQTNRTTVGRLAPSPTGAQHVGNARTYLLAWLSARLQGGKLLLRIEDIDSPRIKPGAAEQAMEDLHWLGIDWDADSDIDEADDDQQDAGFTSKCHWIQTQRLAIYQAYLEELLLAGRLYPCWCTRKDIEQSASAPHTEDHILRYPDTCRNLNLQNLGVSEQLFPSSLDRPFAWRFRCSDEIAEFTDGVCGELSAATHRQYGDFVIARSQGSVAYQLAVVVDDHLMGVSEVVRGDDLIPSTYWQLELYRAFGWTPPRFYHVPLVVGPDGKRLAKRHGDTRLSEIRRRGQGPERLIGVLARSCNLVETSQPLSAQELLTQLQVRSEQNSKLSKSGCAENEQNSNNKKASIDELVWSQLPREPFVLTEATWRYIGG